MRTVTIVGNNSGRNAGDNAILGNMLDDFAKIRTDILFKVPTLNPRFIRKHFGHHNIKPVGLLPWNLALKNLGWPLYHAMTRTEMVLIVDNILFDRQLNNPVFNNLKSISWYASACRKRGVPLVLYNASVGPIDHEAGRRALQKVLDATALIITRDGNTRQLILDKGLRHPEIVVHADCALNTCPPDTERLEEIIAGEALFTNPKGTVGLNINAYIDNWSGPGRFTRQDFLRSMAGTADRLIEELDVDILFTVTQVMDLKITSECVARMKHANRVKTVSNRDYTYQEIAGLLARVDIHAGMRTHTLIFCAAVNTPMISINAYPKSAGFMATIGQDEWNIGFADLSVDRLSNLMIRAWHRRREIRETMKPLVELEKKKARKSVNLVLDLLDKSR